jgi:hypothetical protein
MKKHLQLSRETLHSLAFRAAVGNMDESFHTIGAGCGMTTIVPTRSLGCMVGQTAK